MPGMYSRVMTAGEVRCQLTLGTFTQGTSLKFRLNLQHGQLAWSLKSTDSAGFAYIAVTSVSGAMSSISYTVKS